MRTHFKIRKRVRTRSRMRGRVRRRRRRMVPFLWRVRAWANSSNRRRVFKLSRKGGAASFTSAPNLKAAREGRPSRSGSDS